MLPANIDSLLREQIDTDLLTKGKSERDVAQTALAQGIRSGFSLPALVARAQLEEIGNRSKIIADAILKVLQDVKVTPYPNLVQDLVNLYETSFNVVVDVWMPRLRESQTQGGMTGDGGVTPKIEAWRTEHRMEVKRRGVAIMEPVTGGNVISISIGPNSQVGAIQTGDHATIGTGISMTQQQSQQLIQVLGDLAAMLMTEIPGLNPDKRNELRELATDAQTEVVKPKPNRLKLTALMTMIWAGIKNIDKLKECGQLLGPLLHGMGIHVFP
jgi:hypothetical protein